MRNKCSPDDLLLVVDRVGNCFWTLRGAEVGNNALAVKKGMESTLIRSNKLSDDLTEIINTIRIAFRPQWENVRRDVTCSPFLVQS
jgi:hypothetical protein